MTRSTVSLEDHIQGVLTALSTLTFPIGDGQDPLRDGENHNPPYAVVYLSGGGPQEGPLTDSQADVEIRVQVTSVGRTQTEALRVADLVRSKMKKNLITVTGRVVRDVYTVTASTSVRRDDDLPTPLFYCVDLWGIDTTPS